MFLEQTTQLKKHDFELSIGNYRLFRLLRRNNLTTIYLGEHVHLAQKVVVKILNSWMATEAMVKKFCAEARLHASLRHPNIVRVLDFGMQGRIPFMVADYASKGTLQDVLPLDTPLPLSSILPYVMQAANALQYIHNHNLVHRDIKPQNILVGSYDEVWICDFGITIAMQPWSKQTNYESIGTALYVAPEQIDGRPLVASDQYALAVLIYTLLCGRPPFMGTSLQLCKQHLYHDPPPLRTFVPTLAPGIERTVLKALAKDPYQRFEQVIDFAYALQLSSKEAMTDPILPAIYTINQYQPHPPYVNQ